MSDSTTRPAQGAQIPEDLYALVHEMIYAFDPDVLDAAAWELTQFLFALGYRCEGEEEGLLEQCCSLVLPGEGYCARCLPPRPADTNAGPTTLASAPPSAKMPWEH